MPEPNDPPAEKRATPADPLAMPDNEQRDRLMVRGGVFVTSSRLVMFVISAGSAMVLARLLTPKQFGIFAMGTVLFELLSKARNLGTTEAVVHNPDFDKPTLNALFWTVFRINTAFLILTLAAAPAVAWLFEEPVLIPITFAIAGAAYGGMTLTSPGPIKWVYYTPERFQQAARRILNEIEHAFEARRAAVVRIGNLFLVCRSVFHEQPYLLVMMRLRLLHQQAKVVAVHRQHEVEFLEVALVHPARLDSRKPDTAPFSRCLRAPVGRLTDMVGMRARGIDDDPVSQIRLLEQVAKHALRRRRTADVAHTDK